jgi:hypothetical protein
MRSPHRAGLRVQYNRRSSTGFQLRRNFQRNEKVAGEKIVKQVAERRRPPKLGGGNQPICFTPFPTAERETFQSFSQLRRGHRIGVDAHVLREKTCKRLQKRAFEIAVNAFERSNDQRESCDEAYGRLRVAVYASRHVIELALAKKQHIAACSEKSVDTTEQVRDLRSRFGQSERSDRQAKKANGATVVSPSSLRSSCIPEANNRM